MYNIAMADIAKYTDYKTVLSVNALIFSEGKVLLLKRAANKRLDPNVYSGIGGKVEPGEDFYSALLREIEEETGLKEFQSFRLYSVTQHPFPPQNAEWVNLYFIVKILRQVEIPPNVEGEFFWVDPKEIDDYETPMDIKEYLKILSKNPEAFILGFFDHDHEGNLTDKKIKVL